MTATVNLITDAAGYEAYVNKDNYYMRDNAPKQWFGKGAEMLGLQGAIDPAMFGALLRGELPDGTVLHPGATGVHRPGIDLTFSPGKSYTVGGLVVGDDRLVAAHERAVAIALEALEREVACRTRVNGQDSRQITGNLVVARVPHSVARSVDGQIDPQIHEHAVLMNMTWNEEAGKWQALSNESIFDLQKYAGAIYHAEMARFCREIGWTPKGFANNGLFELEEIPEALCKAMSQRTEKQANEWLEMHGLTRETASPEQLQAAMRWKREAKLHDVDHAELADEWRARAREMGIELKIPDALERVTSSEEQRIAAQVALHESMRHNLEMTNLVERHKLIIDALRFAEGRTSFAAIDKAIDEVGFVRGEYADKLHYTTQAAIAREQAMLGRVMKGRGAMARLMTPNTAASALELDERDARQAAYKEARESGMSHSAAEIEMAKVGLNSGQREAAIAILSSKDQFVVINGVAGAGKTYMLSRVRDHAEAAGMTLVALAPSHQAKNELRSVIGEGETIQKFLMDHEQHEKYGKQHLFVIDECSMVSTEQMAALVRIANERGFRIAMIGDRRQLMAVEGGAPFLQIQRQLGDQVVELNESVRHKTPNLSAAMALYNEGKTAESLATLLTDSTNTNRIRCEPDANKRFNLVADLYMEDRAAGKSSFALTDTNASRFAINDRIRSRLGLAGTGETFTVRESKDLSNVELRKLGSYEVGDVLDFHKTSKTLHAKPGEQMTVKEVASDHVILEGGNGLRTFRPQDLRGNDPGFQLLTMNRNIEFAVGDEVRFRANNKVEGYLNGDLGKVLDVSKDRIVVESRGNTFELDATRAVPLAHEYCLTAHMSQGATRDACVPHIDTSSGMATMNSVGVMATRAKYQVRIVTDDFERLPEMIKSAAEKSNALDLKRQEVTPDWSSIGDRDLPAIDLPEPGGHAQERPEPEPEVDLPPVPSAPDRERDHGMELG